MFVTSSSRVPLGGFSQLQGSSGTQPLQLQKVSIWARFYRYVQLIIDFTSFMGKKAAYLRQALASTYFFFLRMLLMSNFEKDFSLLSQKLEVLEKLSALSLYSFRLLVEALSYDSIHSFSFLYL